MSKRKPRRKEQHKAVETVTIGHHALAFIDILNQKEKLSRIAKLPENDAEKAEFIRQWKETFGVVQAYRSMFHGFFKSFTEERALPADAGKEEREFMRRARRAEVKSQLFSDSMIYYTSLEDRADRFAISGVHTLLSGCAATIFLSLSRKLVCRGGIESGIAGEFFEGEVYGPALYQAYHLESEVARYPRIAVGKSLVEFIASELHLAGGDLDSGYRRGLGKKCGQWLISDVDGVTILDFAGPATKEIFPVLKDAIDPALSFVKAEWQSFRQQGKTELAGRYYLLHNYLLDRKRTVWK